MFLPNELIDYILSFLQSDPYSLKKCACAGPFLSKLADRYLYADITLFDDPRPKVGRTHTTHKLSQILVKKPEIAHYIHSLTIYLKDYGNSPLITVSSLLPMFTQLTSVTIYGNEEDSSWDLLPERFREAFVVFLRAQLKELSISDVSSFPLSSLDGCKNLAKVTLDLCGKLQYEKESMKNRASPLLKHFTFWPCRGMSAEHISGWLQTHNLSSLKFNGAPEALLLAACSHSLTNLCLDKCEPKFLQCQFPFKLASLPHLEHLTICGPIKQNPGENGTFLISGITELVSTAAPSLKNVSLWLKPDFHFHFGRETWLPFVPLEAVCSSLSATVSVFIDSLLFSKLSRVFL